MITKVSCMQVSTQALGTQGVVGSPALMEHSWQGARHPLEIGRASCRERV